MNEFNEKEFELYCIEALERYQRYVENIYVLYGYKIVCEDKKTGKIINIPQFKQKEDDNE